MKTPLWAISQHSMTRCSFGDKDNVCFCEGFWWYVLSKKSAERLTPMHFDVAVFQWAVSNGSLLRQAVLVRLDECKRVSIFRKREILCEEKFWSCKLLALYCLQFYTQ